MTKGEINYKNGKIYKIEPICEHDEGDVYIGSTTKQYLSQRMTVHRKGYKQFKEGKCRKVMTFDIFDKYGFENCNIVLLELVEANSKDELHAREAHYIKTIKCVNKFVPNRTVKEWKEDNKEHIDKITKQYYQENKEKIAEQMKQYYDSNKEKKLEKIKCQCGSEYAKCQQNRHEKSKKHQKYCLTI